jgi:hypothetical protein
MIISIGRFLAIANSLAGHAPRGTKLCNDISYNLRRVLGALHPQALEMEELRSQIYTSAGHYREAMGVHEDILRLIVDGDDGDDRTTDTVSPAVARHHLDLLRASYLRLKGWDKSASNYHDLVRELLNMKGHKSSASFQDAVPAEKWSPKDDPGTLGVLSAPLEWRFFVPCTAETGDATSSATGLRPHMGLKRASSNWRLSFLHKLLPGQHDDEDNESRMATRQIFHRNGRGFGHKH